MRLKDFAACAPTASVTVTVNETIEIVTVEDPVIVPVEPAILRPAGRAGETVKVKGAMPPEPVTGVNEAGLPWVIVFRAVTVVAVTAVSTVNWKLAVAVALLASVTVTV